LLRNYGWSTAAGTVDNQTGLESGIFMGVQGTRSQVAEFLVERMRVARIEATVYVGGHHVAVIVNGKSATLTSQNPDFD